MTALIILPVIGQVPLRDETKNATRVDDHSGVVKTTERAEGDSHSESRKQVRARDAKALQGPFNGIEERLLLQEVIDRIRGESQFREYHHCDPLLVTAPQELKGPSEIELDVGNFNPRNAGRDPDKVVTVG